MTTTSPAAKTIRETGTATGPRRLRNLAAATAAARAWFPFAGWKDSVDGDLHANVGDAVELYTRKKVVTSRWA